MTIGVLMVAAALAASRFPAEFADSNRFVRVDYAKPFDVGVSVRRPSSVVNIDRKSDAVCLSVVPAEEYARAWVLCAADPTPGKDDAFTVRLTRYATGVPEAFLGRGKNAMADSLVELSKAAKKQVGETTVNGKKVPLWLVEVPLRTGDMIQDFIFHTGSGDWLRGDWGILGKELEAAGITKAAPNVRLNPAGNPLYLDFEILGRTKTIREAFTDQRMDTNPAYTSAVHVVSVALEKPSCEMEMAWIRPGNIFWNDEKPETQVKLRVKRPGAHKLVWKITNPEGTVTGGGEHAVAKDETLTVDLAQKEPGWYRIDWTLFDGARTLLTHRASFALLGEVHRQAVKPGEAPYGCLGIFGAHYRFDGKTQQDVAGELLNKVGFHRSWQGGVFSQPNRAKYQMAGAVAMRFDDFLRHPDWTDEQFKAEFDKRLADDPTLRMALVFWEHAADPYRQAAEITGGVHDPRTDPKTVDNYCKVAMRTAKFIHDNYPEMRVLVGNSIASTELVAELLRRGIPNDYADHLGLEVVGRGNLPERQCCESIQGADMMRELAHHFGVSWTPNCCCEATFRLDTLIGEENEANWYVRDLILMQTWGFKDIFIGDILDAGNHYCKDFWGNSGFTRRNPFLYPKKAFVGLATATKFLDRVVAREFLDTGDHAVFAVDFLRADGKHACALWTARGEATVRLAATADFKVYDFYGRDRTPKDAKVTLPRTYVDVKACESPCYVFSDDRAIVRARTVARAYPENREEPGSTEVVRTDDIAKWTLVKGAVAGLHGNRGEYPCRLPGSAAFSQVKDDEKGEVLELELVNPDYTLPVLASEYAVVELKEPVDLPKDATTIGAWVWGNSGWGNVNFVLEDAKGRRMISCGCWKWGEREFDFEGLQTMCYTGWNFIRFPIVQASPVQERSSNEVENSWWIQNDASAVGPFKLVGIAFSAQNRPLVLDKRIAQPQKIRLHSVMAW